MRSIIQLLLILVLFNLSACSWLPVYELTIQQGNVVEKEKVAKLKLGMDRDDVAAIMGFPVLETPFDKNEWNYITHVQHGDKIDLHQYVRLVFKQDKLSAVQWVEK